MYLITKWFGTFICDNNKIKDKILFPKNIKSISNRIIKIEKGEILTEEEKITKNVKNIIVNDSRLKKFGENKPEDPFFKKFKITAEEFGFSEDLFHKATLIVAEHRVKDELESEDLQIIQMVNTLDDFIHISNLLSERFDSWSMIPTPEEKIRPLKNTLTNIKEQMKFLEKEIDKDMYKIAPNITILTGSLIGARLISYSSGIENLAKLPSSTIQILGAEKALFRYKKEGGKPPKHGVIFQHVYINKASKKDRGKIARAFAAKISIAAKADAFTKRNIADDLKKDLEIKIKNIRNK